MIEPKHINLDGKEFVLNPLKILKALCLDKKLMSLLLPSIGGMESFSLDSDINLGTIFQEVGKSLERMKDTDLQAFFLDLFATTQVIIPGKEAIEINASTMDTVFSGSLLTIYKLAFEVMKHNKFSPFVLVEGGSAMEKISGLLNQTSQQKPKQEDSEKSEDSQENSNGNGQFGLS
jgi:hypothetical protein